MKSTPARTLPRWIAGAAVIALLAWIGWAIVAKYDETVNPEPARPAAPIAVHVEVVTAQPFSVERSWLGSIDTDQRALLSAQLTARVMELPQREGARVEAAEMVYRLDDGELQAERARLQAIIEGARTELETAHRELARQQSLFERRLSPERALDEAAQRVDSLVARLAEARAGLDLISTRLDYAVGRAPFAGTIQRLHVQPGELARTGSPILELIADRGLKAVVSLPQDDVGQLHQDMPVRVDIPALDQHWDGRIDRIYPALDAGTRSATLAVLLPPGADRARVGMSAIVHAEPMAHEAALSVPAQAVHTAHGASWLFLSDGDRARRRAIRTGPTAGGRVLIESGLATGESIILTDDPRLADGAPIRIETTGKTP